MKEKIAKFYRNNKKKLWLALIVVIGGGYYFYQSANVQSTPTQYELGAVSKGNVIVSVTGSGQVSALNQVDIKSKVTANSEAPNVVAITAQEKQKVKVGDPIMQLDDTNLKIQLAQVQNQVAAAAANLNLKKAGPTKENLAILQNSIDSAKAALAASKVSYENTKATAAQNLKNAQIQYQNSLATQSVGTSSNNQTLNNAYENAKPTINSALINLRSTLLSADSVLGIDHIPSFPDKNLLAVSNPQSLSDAQSAYAVAKSSLASLETSYASVSIGWDRSQEEALLSQTAVTLQSMKNLEQSIYTVLMNTITASTLSQSSLDSYRSTAASQQATMLSNYNSVQSAIQAISSAKLNFSTSDINSQSSLANAQNSYAQAQLDNKKALDAANNDLASKQLALKNAQDQYNLQTAKPRPEDLASLVAQLAQAQNSYDQAKQNLDSAKIVSPIDGIVAKIPVKVGDQASQAVVLATIITPNQVAEVTLNEVDAAKVKTGQKATLTFNAITDLTMTGEVVSVDTIGTVSQGVVNYTVKIALDTQDERIKPAMSVSASIITDQKFDVVAVPNSAILSDNTGSYVQTLTNTATSSNGFVTSPDTPSKKYIQIGIANDTDSEITSGLSEGDQIVIQTIAGGSASTATSASSRSGLGLLGGGTGGGGAFRAGGARGN